MKTHKGKLSISRFSGPGDGGISIELIDDPSRVHVVRIEVDFEAFGKAVTGQSFQECTFEVCDSRIVGMKLEHKMELVPFDLYSRNEADKRKAVKPFEVDGWKASLSDLGNMHKWVKDKGFTVSFTRHVPNT